jgi:hypothetical protein
MASPTSKNHDPCYNNVDVDVEPDDVAGRVHGDLYDRDADPQPSVEHNQLFSRVDRHQAAAATPDNTTPIYDELLREVQNSATPEETVALDEHNRPFRTKPSA